MAWIEELFCSAVKSIIYHMSGENDLSGFPGAGEVPNDSDNSAPGVTPDEI